MSLQLYQVDYKSYLLDFKSLSNEENDEISIGNSNDILQIILFKFFIGKNSNYNNLMCISDPLSPPLKATGYHTMEFFEMCAALITQLAR